jgi:hypothetical protein
MLSGTTEYRNEDNGTDNGAGVRGGTSRTMIFTSGGLLV